MSLSRSLTLVLCFGLLLQPCLAAEPASRAAIGQGAAAEVHVARILVMPFENVTRDSRIFWLGEASAVLLTDDLNALSANAASRSR